MFMYSVKIIFVTHCINDFAAHSTAQQQHDLLPLIEKSSPFASSSIYDTKTTDTLINTNQPVCFDQCHKATLNSLTVQM